MKKISIALSMDILRNFINKSLIELRDFLSEEKAKVFNKLEIEPYKVKVRLYDKEFNEYVYDVSEDLISVKKINGVDEIFSIIAKEGVFTDEVYRNIITNCEKYIAGITKCIDCGKEIEIGKSANKFFNEHLCSKCFNARLRTLKPYFKK